MYTDIKKKGRTDQGQKLIRAKGPCAKVNQGNLGRTGPDSV